MIQQINVYYSDLTLDFSNFNFHYDESQYARTIDGYLRARIATHHIDQFRRHNCNCTFFVINYLPQKVDLSYAFVNSSSREVTLTPPNNVRIYFSNTEGVDRIVLQCLREGARIPGKIEISDIKKGYYETHVDRTTTFTAVSYNENGSAIGSPITITPIPETPSLSFTLESNRIIVKSTKSFSDDCEYLFITPGTGAKYPLQTFDANGNVGVIDISFLPSGTYVLNFFDHKLEVSGTFKFQK